MATISKPANRLTLRDSIPANLHLRRRLAYGIITETATVGNLDVICNPSSLILTVVKLPYRKAIMAL